MWELEVYGGDPGLTEAKPFTPIHLAAPPPTVNIIDE
jgi:hypothetical protein